MQTIATQPAGPTLPRPTRLVLVTLALVAVLAIVVGLALRRSHQVSAVARLPVAQRQELYANELSAFRELCTGPRAADLRGHCDERASFLLSFPECGSDCRTLVRVAQPVPTR